MKVLRTTVGVTYFIAQTETPDKTGKFPRRGRATFPDGGDPCFYVALPLIGISTVQHIRSTDGQT